MIHFAVTRHPTDAWVAQQVREATPYGQAPRFLICDNDSKYGGKFASVVNHSGMELLRTPYRAPRANAVCERFLRSVRNECLDHLLILNERRLYCVVNEYVAFYNSARPHQGIGQQIPERVQNQQGEKCAGKIVAFPVLNGLHHDYRRVA